MAHIDRISSLPDSVLCHILSLLDTQEAVATSILSTRWRFLFLSLSRFDLDDAYSDTTITNNAEFLDFVDRVLVFHTKTNINELCLNIREDSSRVYSWISAATTLRGVQHLDLCITTMEEIKLPDVLFTCKTLMVLKLQAEMVLYVPDEICLPNLKSLHLLYLEFLEDDSIQRLISSCNMLEEFLLDMCVLNGSRFVICHPFLKRLVMFFENPDISHDPCFVIDAPSLVYLEYHDYVAPAYSLLNLNSLVKADITLLTDVDEDDLETSEVSSANELFRGIAHVKSLILGNSSTTQLLCLELLPLFDKLVEIRLNFMDAEERIFDVLQSVPNLEKLSFLWEATVISLPENVPSCLLYNLKKIEVKLGYPLPFENLEDLLKNTLILEYLLKNASILEKLIIYAPRYNENIKLEIAEKLLASPRKSKTCSILVI